VLVVVTSLLRTQLGRPLWRSLHYLVFPSAVLLFLHSVLTDPNLKDGHPDLLDGGKVLIEISLLRQRSAFACADEDFVTSENGVGVRNIISCSVVVRRR
jgi:DMSO/TMAO reductase YedYZ heme-binding membrane subunit